MKDQSLQLKLKRGLLGRILESINNAEELIGRQEIRFPRIAVFGDESTGKSSLMEAICGVPFPRGEQVTTKAATQVRLLRTDAPWSAKAWTGGQQDSMSEKYNQVEVSSPEELTAVIKDLQDKEIQRGRDSGSNSTFATEHITIEIRAPDIVDLTLVDLPGYFQRSAMEKNSNSDRDVEVVTQTLEDYVEDDSTILLVVIKATANLKNVNILSLIEDYKAKLKPKDRAKFIARTMYCFTMCDLLKPHGKVGANHNMEEVLLNENEHWKAEPHGWYAVANNMSEGKGVSGTDRLKLDRKEEANFFAQYEPYTHPKIKDHCGTENLIAKLTSVLAQEIEHNIDGMRTESEKALQSAKEELKEMGPEDKFQRNPQSEFDAVVTDLRRYFTEAGNGEYGAFKEVAEGISVEGLEEVLENIELGGKVHKRCERFKNDVLQSRIDTTSNEYQQDLHKKVETAKDGRMDKILMDKNVVMYEVRGNAKRWKALADAMYDDIAELANSCLDVIIRVCSAKYKTLPQVLLTHLTSLIEEQKEKALLRLKWHYLDEILRPNTLVDGFVESYSKKKGAGLGASDEQNRNTFTEALDAYLPAAEARFIDNAVRTIMTHILDVPLGNRETRFDTEPKFMFNSQAIRVDRDLEELMALSEDLAEKHAQISKKVEKLESLRNALRDFCVPGGTVKDAEVNGTVEDTEEPPKSSNGVHANGN